MLDTGWGASIVCKLKHLSALKEQVWRESSKVTSEVTSPAMTEASSECCENIEKVSLT